MAQKVCWSGWETVRLIGRGSFGMVYEIQRDIQGNGDMEKAALKVITIPRDEDEVEYLRVTGLSDNSITQNFYQQAGDITREYMLMKQMRDNPNVVRCDDFQKIKHEDGLGWDIYIRMELLTPLMKALDQVSTEAQIIRLGKDLCNALVACQEANIIHRDIKPQNVFVSDNGRFKLGDFGIARTVERTTRATARIGTNAYMAPEVEKNEPYGKTADIYSLGLLLYWLLNERRMPFLPLPPDVPKYGEEEKAIQRRKSGEPLPAPKNGSDELKRIVLKACAYVPADRYATAADMLQDLNDVTDVETLRLKKEREERERLKKEQEARARVLREQEEWERRRKEQEREQIQREQEASAHRKKEAGKQNRKIVLAVVAVAVVIAVVALFYFGLRPVGWKQTDEGYYFYDENSVMQKGWLEWRDRWYYLDENGIMRTDWTRVNGKWYYMNGAGVMQTGWIQSKGDWYYLDSNGIMQTGWLQIQGSFFYLDSNGIMQTGWTQIQGYYYYFDSDGIMQTGWEQVQGKWYYLDENGIMQTGWQEIGEHWYYFESDGAMVTGNMTIDGIEYTFDAEGRLEE